MAVYEMIHDIQINDITLSKIISVNIQKNINNYTNTCMIKLPKKVKKDNARVFTTIDSFLFKPQDVVKVKLGYRQGLDTNNDEFQFEGFVSTVDLDDDRVATIVVEDYMYFLKKVSFNFSSASISLKELGEQIISEVNAIIPSGIDPIAVSPSAIELTLKNFKAEEATGIDVLRLLEKYSLKSYFKGNVLHIGINYSSQDINSEIGSDRENFTFSEYPRELVKTVTNEIPLFIIDRKGLKFQRAEEVLFNITAKVFKADNTVEESSFGDPSGEKIQFVFYGDFSASELETLVENQVERLKYTGFKNGSTFKTFGKPTIEPLDICSLDGIGSITYFDKSRPNETSPKVYEKSSYLIEGVNTTYDNIGFKQVLLLANRIGIEADSDSIVSKLEDKFIEIDENN
jgi:hypothetical protein